MEAQREGICMWKKSVRQGKRERKKKKREKKKRNRRKHAKRDMWMRFRIVKEKERKKMEEKT